MEELVGAMLSLASGFGFGFRDITLRVGVVRTHPLVGVFFSIAMSLVVGVVFGAVSGDLGRIYVWNPYVVLYLAVAGILHFLVGRYFSYWSVKLIGASRTATFLNSNLVFSALFGVILLNEAVDLLLLSGILLILFGVTIISLGGERRWWSWVASRGYPC